VEKKAAAAEATTKRQHKSLETFHISIYVYVMDFAQ
jgi:hypothetical protein